VAGTCECGNELSGSLKCREFLDLVRAFWLLRKDSAPCTEFVSYLVSMFFIEESAGFSSNAITALRGLK